MVGIVAVSERLLVPVETTGDPVAGVRPCFRPAGCVEGCLPAAWIAPLLLPPQATAAPRSSPAARRRAVRPVLEFGGASPRLFGPWGSGRRGRRVP